jgi:hypothetical protein
MKLDNKMIVMISAGLAVAGLVGYLLYTKNGKNLTGNMKMKGKELKAKMEDMVGDGREKWDGLKKEMMNTGKEMLSEVKI